MDNGEAQTGLVTVKEVAMDGTVVQCKCMDFVQKVHNEFILLHIQSHNAASFVVFKEILCGVKYYMVPHTQDYRGKILHFVLIFLQACFILREKKWIVLVGEYFVGQKKDQNN